MTLVEELRSKKSRDNRELLDRAADRIEELEAEYRKIHDNIGEFSDGYHTFNELYHHRAVLFCKICELFPELAWKSLLHDTGDMYDGMFIVGIETEYRKTNIDLSDYEDYGSFEEFDFAKNLPGMYALSKAVAGNFATFRKYAKDLNNIRTDKDKNGKPISGSRKKKVVDYINSLEDSEYGERIILYKSQYKSDNIYNADILEYLNSRNDLTYEERIAILKELGFKISADGKTASW